MRGQIYIVGVILACFFLAIATPALASDNYYQISYFSYNDSTSPNVVDTVGINTNFDCTFNSTLKQSYNGASYSVVNTLYSPQDTVKAVSSFDGTTSVSCREIAIFQNLLNEARLESVYTATSGNSTMQNTFICTSDNRFIEITAPEIKNDNFSTQYNAYAERSSTKLSLSTIESRITGITDCYTPLNPTPFINDTGSIGGGAPSWYISYAYIPFNSTGGMVNYHFSGEADNAPHVLAQISGYAITGSHANVTLWLYDVEDATMTEIYSEQDTCGIGATCSINTNITGSQNLGMDKLYYFILKSQVYAPAGGAPVTYYLSQPADYNISIDSYHGDYNCTLGECIDSLRIKTCVDNNGIANDIITLEACFDVPSTDIYLGFEDYYEDTVSLCTIEWYTGCEHTPSDITIKLPVGWSTSSNRFTATGQYKRNYIQIFDGVSTEGGSSLRMHYVPPRQYEPIGGTSPTCGNLTAGAIPQTEKGYNESLFTEYNVTFDSPYPQLRYDVKKCTEHALQYDYTGNTLGCQWKLDAMGWPVDRCYAPQCNSTVYGSYGVWLKDAETDTIIAKIPKTAGNEWSKNNIIDFSNLGLTAGGNYTIIFIVNPYHEYDTRGHCVHFDNVRATFTDAALPECSSRCDGYDWIQADLVNDTVCTFTTYPEYGDCAVTDAQAEAIQNKERYCDPADGTTLHFYNNITNDWEIIENADYCVNQQATETVEEEGTQAIAEVFGEGSGLEDFNVLFSIWAVVFFISLALSGIVGYKTESGTAFLGTLAACVIVFAVLGIFHIGAAILIAIVCALLIGVELRKGMAG